VPVDAKTKFEAADILQILKYLNFQWTDPRLTLHAAISDANPAAVEFWSRSEQVPRRPLAGAQVPLRPAYFPGGIQERAHMPTGLLARMSTGSRPSSAHAAHEAR
jgi:hypothetical protein